MPDYEHIEPAPQVQIEQYEDILEDFTNRVIYPILKVKDLWVSDWSSLHDFDAEIVDGKVVHHTEEFLEKIKEVYGIDISDVEDLLLVEIFKRIRILCQ